MTTEKDTFPRPFKPDAAFLQAPPPPPGPLPADVPVKDARTGRFVYPDLLATQIPLSINLFLKIESTLKLKLKPIKCLITLKEVSQKIVYILLC